MKERQIRFSAPMVRAILDGSKTMTRRVVKQDREGLLDCEPTPAWDAFWQCVACPYGKPGDRITVDRHPDILLEITDVRVERLQDISDRDARDEGAEHIGDCEGAYAAGFRRLWESINGPDSWAANPWVWVIEFRRIEP